MPFVPRGHVPLAPVVQRLFEQFTTGARAGYLRAQQDLRQTVEQPGVPPDTPGSPMLSMVRRGRSSAEDLSDEQRVHVREMARCTQLIRAIQQIIANVIQQDLGMGDSQAIALSRNGEIVDIPTRAWRTKIGERALVDGGISWADPGIGMTSPAEVFVADAILERWIDMAHAAVRDMVDEPASIATTSGKSPTAVGPADRVENKLVNRRVHVSPGKANEWMFDAATAAQAAGEGFGRDLGVEQCQEALNCTRDVARSAYTKLPDALKQPRGKAIKKPA